uniref:Uncharacterized protein n=2 Tax=Micrurus TaxID=8634 RepID=A0A2D4FKA6_MICCO
MIFKGLQGMKLGYMRDPFLSISAYPIRSGRKCVLQVLSVKKLHVAGPRRWAVSALAPILDILEVPQNNMAMSTNLGNLKRLLNQQGCYIPYNIESFFLVLIMLNF